MEKILHQILQELQSVRQDIHQLQQSQSRLDENQVRLEQNQSEMSGRFERVEQNQNDMSARLERIEQAVIRIEEAQPKDIMAMLHNIHNDLIDKDSAISVLNKRMFRLETDVEKLSKQSG